MASNAGTDRRPWPRMIAALALGAAITGLGVFSTIDAVPHVGRDAWIGFVAAFAAGLLGAGLIRYGDFKRAAAGGRLSAFRVLGPGVGAGVGFALALAVGAGARLVVLGACGGVMIGAAVLYAAFPVRGRR